MTDMIRSGLVQYHPNLQPLMVPVDQVSPHPDNYNSGDLDKIAESIEINGMYRPVYAQTSTGYILAGNGTYHACLALDASQIPVLWLDVDDATADRILGADNWVAALAVPDPALELALLERIAEHDSLLGTGKTDADLEALRKLSQAPLTPVDLDQTWPTICVQVPPATKDTYYRLTAAAGGDRERFEMLLALAQA